MLANIKFDCLEDLKKMRAEGYDYNEFLSDSSDDSLPFPCDKEDEQILKSQMSFPKTDEDNLTPNFAKLRVEENQELITCLNNVLSLAEQKLGEYKAQQWYSNSIDLNTKVDINEISIKAIKSFLYKVQDSNIILAKDKENK